VPSETKCLGILGKFEEVGRVVVQSLVPVCFLAAGMETAQH